MASARGKATKRYVALLRGINVGGNNIIPMADLRAAFEGLGLTDVVTYIQSGNVVFSSSQTSKASLTTKIEAGLSAAFGYDAKLVVLSADDMASVVEEAPRGFGTKPDRYRYDVLFVKPPLRPNAALADIPLAPGVDEAHAGAHAIYFRRAIADVTKSKLSRVTQRPVYASLTIRNWRTTTKLLALAVPADA